MATNFRIIIHRNSDNLHLKLIGNFDGSSACELINIMASKASKKGKIFIHTANLSAIHPFGKDLFHEKARGYYKMGNNITFTGKLGSQLALPGSRLG
jgi:hypothetical protein